MHSFLDKNDFRTSQRQKKIERQIFMVDAQTPNIQGDEKGHREGSPAIRALRGCGTSDSMIGTSTKERLVMPRSVAIVLPLK